MLFPDYKYVDVAIGGCNQRNNVTNYGDLDIAVGAVDCFTSMYLFCQDYRDYAVKAGTVRGANKYPCYCPWLFFDIDNSEDLDAATLNAQTLVRGLLSMTQPKYLTVAFSGCKGYSIGIASALFGFVPSVTLPSEMRAVAQQLASLFSVDIDTKIYESARLWRLIDTVHSATGLFKTAFDPIEFPTLSTDEIRAKAANKKGRKAPAYLLAGKVRPDDHLVTLREEAVSGHIKKVSEWEAPPLDGNKLKVVQTALDILLKRGIGKGNRDNEGLLRASEARKAGLTQAECTERVALWNQLNRPPLDDESLKRIVSSAYTGAGYDFGFNNESLATARTWAEKGIVDVPSEEFLEELLAESDIYCTQEIDIADDRAHSFGELTEGGLPEPPELVGNWFSWRGRISLVAGREKTSGKSTICTWEAIACLQKGYKVMWVSPDEPRNDILTRLGDAGAGDFNETLFVEGNEHVPRSWRSLGRRILQVRPALIVLDSVHSLFPILIGGKLPDNSEGAEWQLLITKLRPFATRLDIAVVWIHHANKATGLSTGSIGITAGVDAIVTIQPLASPKTEQAHRIRKLQFLGRFVGRESNCALEYLGKTQGYQVCEFQDDTDDNSQSQLKRGKVYQVMEWLQEYLQTKAIAIDHSVIVTAYKQAFPKASESLLNNASSRLKYNIEKDRGRKGHSTWQWKDTITPNEAIDNEAEEGTDNNE